MLEDESGRIQLVGERLKSARLVTGVIIGALGMETPNGEFEVVDICSANFAPQGSVDSDTEEMSVDSERDDHCGLWFVRCADIFVRLCIGPMGWRHLRAGGRLRSILRRTDTDAH